MSDIASRMDSIRASAEGDKALQVKAEQVKILFAKSTPVAIAHICSATMVSFLLWDQIGVSHMGLLLISAIIISASVASLVIYNVYDRASISLSQIDYWIKQFLIGSVAIGLAWSGSVIWLFQRVDHFHQFILIIVIGGISAVSTLTLSAVRTAYIIIVPLLLFPITVMIFLEEYHDSSALAALLVLFAIGFCVGGELNFRNIVQNIALRIESDERENAIRESEERYSGIVGQAKDAIISIDEEQRIIQFNPAAEKIFGFSSEEVNGRDVSIMIPERYHKKQFVKILHLPF